VNLLEEWKIVCFLSYWLLSALWFVAFALDCNSVAIGQASCENTTGWGSYTCSNSTYGISIAVDLCIFVFVSLVLYINQTRKGDAANNDNNLSRV
jgi:hypothetical protein